MRKRRSPLHNHIHAMIMPRPPPHLRLSSSGIYLPLQLYHRRLANHTNALFSPFLPSPCRSFAQQSRVCSTLLCFFNNGNQPI